MTKRLTFGCLFLQFFFLCKAQDYLPAFQLERLVLPSFCGNFVPNFYVNEYSKVFVPASGGIYVLNDSAWFIPPSEKSYVTAFAPNLKDTGLFAIDHKSDSNVLLYLKKSSHKTLMTVVAGLPAGLYQVLSSEGICLVTGYDGKFSRVGIVQPGKVQWLFQYPGLIRQFQVYHDEIFAAIGKQIFNLNKGENLVGFEDTVDGFCFDALGNLIVATAKGVGIVKKEGMLLLAKGVSGLLQRCNSSIYVLSNKDHALYTIQPSLNN
jgi:hypothetical protein